MHYQVVIVEDEKYAAQYLKDTLATIAPDMEVVAILDSVESVKQQLPLLNVDLVLADIHLDDGISFSAFEFLQWKKPVIFITAYDAYAIKAFKTSGIDYLLKPCDEEELSIALDKFRNSQVHQSVESLYEKIKMLATEKNNYKERFAVTLGSRLLSIPVAEVSYFYSANKVIFIVKSDGQKLPYSGSLDQLSSSVDPKHFFRVNRNFLITHQAIEKIEIHAGRNVVVHIKPGTGSDSLVQVSKDRIVEFKCWLDY
ncbi:LytTR family DNA-binding domain-containing protein [Sediminibacterium sp. KACHI17]|uniref:LytTR family DNA-binding domain-containing protein n=1 Tax=Sediminibacterium sp. KACHI17 TaxID=1751071 RepID=A0AAT9GMH1_9BACT